MLFLIYLLRRLNIPDTAVIKAIREKGMDGEVAIFCTKGEGREKGAGFVLARNCV